MGKTREQSTSIDPELQKQSLKALERAWQSSEIPFMPNRGVRAAAFTPDQEAAFKSRNMAAEAAGLPQGGRPGMPPLESANGIPGYSTGSIYDQTLNASVPSAIQEYIASMFVDPATGLRPGEQPQQVQQPQQPTNPYNQINPYWGKGGGGYSEGSYGGHGGAGKSDGFGGFGGAIGDAFGGLW